MLLLCRPRIGMIDASCLRLALFLLKRIKKIRTVSICSANRLPKKKK